ncbi:NUDIX hydrolase [Thermodesulforhabdus norvegica]|uniref:NUDIX domain-containing protein n=1 Tax=Thermodesulforhabdus norvegica TaxID=39841 RepID=A0A1I4TH22_9BACT|nr:CoA pyrophosphatase [Thermodesulforhabdus norvegica]SFM76014.1 NUDIX domain-containing protein [Thermodesulforhabdus norvegica]
MSELDFREERSFEYLEARSREIYPEILDVLRFEDLGNYSSVLVPLREVSGHLSIMLNKRSRFVPQPGDLCFPGGRIEPLVDTLIGLGVLLKKPWFVEKAGGKKRLISLLMSTAFRESWEELRLNPFRIEPLGILPPQDLVMFKKRIIPFLGRIKGDPNLRVNGREVEKVIWLPVKDLFLKERYALYRLYGLPGRDENEGVDFPCFLYQDGVSVEILWGATYRIVMTFLKVFWGFAPPELESRPVVPGTFSKNYLTGYDA